jgi:putative endonuclease
MDNPKTTKTAGDLAEEHALNYLLKNNLKLIERNYRCARGEIDLIMQEKDCVVFVEVRMRNHHGFGSGAASVTRLKQKKIIWAATHYLCSKKSFNKVNCRFDVIGISYNPTGANLEWIKNAFSTHYF